MAFLYTNDNHAEKGTMDIPWFTKQTHAIYLSKNLSKINQPIYLFLHTYIWTNQESENSLLWGKKLMKTLENGKTTHAHVLGELIKYLINEENKVWGRGGG